MPEEPALDLISTALRRGTCLQLSLSDPQAEPRERFSKVVVRPVIVRRRPLWQFTNHLPRRVTHDNLEAGPAASRVAELLQETFQQGMLYTADADVAVRREPDGSLRVSTAAPSRSPPAVDSGAHNRKKDYLIPEGTPCPFLAEMGVMLPDGHVRRGMAHKFRQVNRFLELVNDIVPFLPEDRAVQVVDFGCGKSYLTFALHHLLVNIHGRSVHIVGFDREREVIQRCADAARRLECAGLEFRTGEIAAVELTPPIDLVVSLHACDTATDAALARAFRLDCPVILAVPCCQHELGPRLRSRPLGPLLKHGILRERFAALATDALRAVLLERLGYSTQVTEFIDLEHTAKNVLIRAVRRAPPDVERGTRLAAECQELKDLLGIETCALERALEPCRESPA